MVSAQVKGKTVVFTESDKKSLRVKLRNGVSFDGLNDNEKILACELGREESVRWYKSNVEAQKKRETVKLITEVAKDDEKKKKLEEILGITIA